MCGRAAVRETDQGYETACLDPSYFYPPLEIFRIPDACPADVGQEIESGFALFWSDHSGVMNHFRKAVELILDKLRVRKTTVVTKKGKRHYHYFSLHTRIDEYRKKRPELAEQLEALKWLGNVGSHSSSVKLDDVFDACDILEHFIQETFERRGDKVKKIAKSINRTKKPRSHSNSSR